MVLLVDTVDVTSARVDHYLELVRTVAVPVMTEAGAVLVSCAATPADMGEDVAVQVVWGFEDFVRWNEIRRNLVLDPRWHRFGRAAARLRTGGTRRFFTPLTLTPDELHRQEATDPPDGAGG